MHEASQVVAGVHQPTLNQRDMRHTLGDSPGTDPRVVAYLTPVGVSHDFEGFSTRKRTVYEGGEQGSKNEWEKQGWMTREGLDSGKEDNCFDGLKLERTGVFHLVHSWHQQGTSVNVKLLFLALHFGKLTSPL